MGLSKKKKNWDTNSKRFLININVLGSVGPIRFVVNETELVTTVIDTTLKLYAREGRLPVLGNDINEFYLHCTHVESYALHPRDAIGSHGARNFMLCKKPQTSTPTSIDENRTSSLSRRGSGNLRAWLNKSLKLIIS
ncbi:hypothetical protein Lal_00024100 [Lupinus albus]|uniref:DUF7054 domain-containing protein n=1 Tax=Lupinus albus TaxID=3870 RepID=A0A6A4PHX4_LUPAL|nr:hypothetical protein Lalb_Chr13g0293821 [Lupinus albus]KAF1888088.1 hypothetical protein Lal_00024100 [Lupinus albus]